MDQPANSMLFRPERFGGGYGAVTDGPFANWQTPVGPLERSIAGDGSLMNKRLVDLILARTRSSEIVQGTADTNVMRSCEGQHNAVHVWIGGLMGGTNTAAYEPIFFMHHAYVDCLWHLFQRQQRRLGINTMDDYPETFRYRNCGRFSPRFQAI